MQNQRPPYYELLAPRAPALDLSYVSHLPNVKAVEEPTKLNYCLGKMLPTLGASTPLTFPDQALSLNAPANDFIPNPKSSVAATTPITKLDEDKRFYYRKGALYNRMCLNPSLTAVDKEPNSKQAKGEQSNIHPSKWISDRFADDDHLLITDSDFDDEYEAGYDPMDAPIPNIKGICFQNPYFELDENLENIDINNDVIPQLHFAKLHEKSRMAGNSSLTRLTNGLPHSKGYKAHHPEVYEKPALGEPQDAIQKSQLFNLPINKRLMKTNLVEPNDNDVTLQNLRQMVDNLLMEPTEINPEDNQLNVIKEEPLASCLRENQNKDKIQPFRRGQGRSRSSGFTEMFGIYSPPTTRHHQNSLPNVLETKHKVAAKTVLSLFKPKLRDSPILTLPITQRRLACKENFGFAQNNEWPSLPKGER